VYRQTFPAGCENELSLALGGGEDYELLFTVQPEQVGSLQQLASSLAVKISVIGEITVKPGLRFLQRDGREFRMAAPGFDHFSP
jgi:thiamine-monophosphate kinase